jgi:O-antigen/teichoic acid export membrane protein
MRAPSPEDNVSQLALESELGDSTAIPATTGAAVLRGGAWKVLGATLPQIYTLIVSIVAARVLGPDGTGRQSFIAFSEATAISLLSLGLPAALMRYVAEMVGAGRVPSAKALFAWAWRLEAVAAAAGGALFLAFALAGAQPRSAWMFAAAVCLFGVFGTVPAAVLTGLQLWRKAVVNTVVTGAAATAGTVLVLYLGGGISGMIAVEAVASIASLIWATLLARRPLAEIVAAPAAGERVLRRSVLRYGAAASAGVVLELIVWRRSEFFFLAGYSTDAEIAFYSIAFAIANAVIRLPSTAAATMAPAVANLLGSGEHDRIRSGFSRALRLIAFFTFPVVALVLALGPSLVRLLWGDNFAPAGHVLLVLAASSVVVPFATVSYATLAGLGSIRPMLIADSLAALVDIGLAFALVPHHGAMGAAVANAAAQVASCLPLVFYASHRLGPIRIEGRALAGILVASTGCGLAAWGTNIALGDLAGVLVGAFVGICSLLAIGRAAGMLTADDALWITEAAPGTVRRFVAPVARMASRRL